MQSEKLLDSSILSGCFSEPTDKLLSLVLSAWLRLTSLRTPNLYAAIMFRNKRKPKPHLLRSHGVNRLI